MSNQRYEPVRYRLQASWILPKVASFANIEKDAPTEEQKAQLEREQFLQAGAARGMCLSIVAKKFLSESKLPVPRRGAFSAVRPFNTRIYNALRISFKQLQFQEARLSMGIVAEESEPDRRFVQGI